MSRFAPSSLVVLFAVVAGVVAAGCFAPESQRCDDGRVCPPGWQCSARHDKCVPEGCGDGRVDPGEECDDGGDNSDERPDACRTDCARAGCGDSVIDTGEQCDDGNKVSGDGCTAGCVDEICGSGVRGGLEGCDDGNLRSADGCSSDCRVEALEWREFEGQGAAPVHAAMVYDVARGHMLQFGGLIGEGSSSGTWAYAGVGWDDVTPPLSPTARFWHAMAYDSRRERTVLFGGWFNSFDDSTWEHDGTQWTKASSGGASPGWRYGHAMAYHAGRDRVLLFGGKDIDRLRSDTWSWDGTQWQPLPSPEHPRSLEFAQMTYDASADVVVLFGGSAWGAGGVPEYLSNTWEHDGDAWREAVTAVAPPGRTRHAMTYDAARRVVLLVGGVVDEIDYLADTWEYDGRDWWERAPLPAEPRAGHSLAFDRDRGRAVLRGGLNTSGRLGDTWERAGAQWQPPAFRTPGRLDSAALVYDPLGGRILLFGGADGAHRDGTYAYDGAAWVRLDPPVSPPARTGHAMTYDLARGRVVLFGGGDGVYLLDDTWVFDGTSWSELASGPNPPPSRSRTAMAYDVDRDRVVLFGGVRYTPQGATLRLGDTWEHDGTSWREVQPPLAPLPRNDHAMVYDRSRRRTVVFGGEVGDSDPFRVADTWEYDGATWVEARPGDAPPARYGHAMAYDSRRDRVVVFGGWRLTYFGDVWEYDGDTWRRRELAGGPVPRVGTLMAYDERRQALVLFGGRSASGGLDDTWELRYASGAEGERCDDGLDNDRDGQIDCADPDCRLDPGCPPASCAACGPAACGGVRCGDHGEVCIGARCQCPGGDVEMACGDGADNDCDGRRDCADPDCRQSITELTCGVDVSGSTDAGSTSHAIYPCLLGTVYNMPEAVYRFVAPRSGTVEVRTAWALTSPRERRSRLALVVLRGEADGTCDVTQCEGYDRPGTATLTVVEGETLYLILDGAHNALADYSIGVRCP